MATDRQKRDAEPDRPFRGRLGKLWGDTRQMLFAPAFRIEAPATPSESPPLVESPVAPAGEPGAAPRPGPDTRCDVKELLSLLTDVTTGLWRLKRKMAPPGQTEAPAELKRLYRYVESAWDTLASGKVEVRDPTGERYVDGMALKVIAFQPTEGTVEETIAETIKPSIFYRDQLVQRGEVIVATPPKHECETHPAQ